MIKISIVIPVRNEAENISELIREIENVLKVAGYSYELIIVNDHSTDSTKMLLDKLKKNSKRLISTDLLDKCGKDAALIEGLKIAKGKFIVTLDGDLQNDPADILKMIKLTDEYDVVCGVRSKRMEGIIKKTASRIANLIRNKITGEHLNDAGCALKIIKRECIKKLVLMETPLYSCAHYFYPTILKSFGYKITGIQVNDRPRKAGLSKFPVFKGRAINGLRACLKIRKIKKQLSK